LLECWYFFFNLFSWQEEVLWKKKLENKVLQACQLAAWERAAREKEDAKVLQICHVKWLESFLLKY
jgi:hypothetical protein